MTARLKICLSIAVVVAVLVGGYLLGGVGMGGGESGGDSAPKTAVASRTPEIADYDLARDEARGGHTLARHVGQSDAELRARLKSEPDISAASSYTDRSTAERVVAAVIANNRAKVTSWEKASSHANLAIRVTTKQVIGRSIERGAGKVVDVKSAVVVLSWGGQDWYVLTSYPEDR